MPYRNQSIIRRDINRLKETIERNIEKSPALKAVLLPVTGAANLVNSTWQDYQSASVAGDKERDERDLAADKVVEWIQAWRPVMMISVPGADDNIDKLPSSGATPDDIARVAEDMVKMIKTDPATSLFRQTAIDDLGDGITNSRKETSEASSALLAEVSSRQAYSKACINANKILVRGTEIVRSIFGRTSPEYKQFIARDSSKEEETTDNESSTGEA